MRWLHAGWAGASVVVALAWGCLALGLAEARQAPVGDCQCATGPTVPQTLEALALLSCCELEQLYRQAEARPIPAGYARGRPIYCQDKRFAGAKSTMTGCVWHGKIIDPVSCTLVNQWLGFRAIKARTYFGESWLDGKPSLIMDYAGMSLVWADVRDEVREVAPGLFVGAMFRRKKAGPKFEMFFALEAPTGGKCGPCSP